MYTTKALTAFALLAFLGQASAGCYPKGSEASKESLDAAQKDSVVETICSAFTGSYEQQKERNNCIEIGGSRYNFLVKYYKENGWFFNALATRTMGLEECRENIKKELTSSRGGDHSYSIWYYRYVLFSMLATR